MPEWYAVVPLACDFAGEGASLGPETKQRLDAAVLEYRRVNSYSYYAPVFILSAGMAPGRKFPRQRETFAEMMREYLKEKLIFEDIVETTEEADAAFIVAKNSELWGSTAELDFAADQMLNRGIYRAVIVSSGYHLPRLRIIWRRVCRVRGFRPKETLFRGPPGRFSVAVHEFYKLPLTLAGMRTRPRFRPV